MSFSSGPETLYTTAYLIRLGSVGPNNGPTLVKLSGALPDGIILMTMVGGYKFIGYVLLKTICLVFNVFGIAL